MINPKAFLSLPINFNDICYIYPAKVKDIVGNKNFPAFRSLLTSSQEDLQDLYAEKNIQDTPPTPFEYLLSLYYNNKPVQDLIERAFYFFTHEQVIVLPMAKKIIIGTKEDVAKATSLDKVKMIDEDNFFDFQNAIRLSLGEKSVKRPDPDEDPRVARIKAKARYRDKIKAKKGDGLSLTATLASICCMDFGLNPLNIGEISYASIGTLIRYYQEKDKYHTDVSSLLAGADSKQVHPEYWVRNIEE